MGAGAWSSRLGSSGLAPYTDDEEAYTTRGTAWRRAASSTCRVPSTLLALAPSGSATERGTERMAAWWKMTAAPATARSTSSSRLTSPRWISSRRRERQVRLAARREVVEHPHDAVGVLAQQPLDEVGADEAGAAGDDEDGIHAGDCITAALPNPLPAWRYSSRG